MLPTDVYDVAMDLAPIDIGRRIRALREARGWSQGQLGLRSGVLSSHISLIEQGKRRPKYETIQKLANALTVPVDELIGPSEERIIDLYGEDWRERAIREYAPNVPVDQARELLRLFDRLTGPDRQLTLDFMVMTFNSRRASDRRLYDLDRDRASEREANDGTVNSLESAIKRRKREG